MNYKLYFVVLFLFSSTFSHAERIRIDSTNPISIERELAEPHSFEFDNSVGLIEIFEGKGSNVEISATYIGSNFAHLVFEGPANGTARLVIEYPNSGLIGASGNVDMVIDGSQVSISNIRAQGNVFIKIGGTVIVNSSGRQNVNSGGQINISGTGSGEVRLKVGIPTHLLANLKVDTLSGDIEVQGEFLNNLMQQRQLVLKSLSGNVTCSGLCSLGKIQVTTTSGDIEVDNLKGDVILESMSGSIDATNGQGALKNVRTSAARL